MAWVWNKEKTEKLIHLVFQRTALWNGTHPQCKNNNYMGKLWEEVAQNMGLLDKKEGKDKCRNKWRALVSKYGIEKSKIETLRSGAGADEIIKSSWIHYDSMQFIKDTYAKKSQGNVDFLTSPSQSFDDVSTSTAKINVENLPVKNDTTESDKIMTGDKSANDISLNKEAEWNSFISFLPFLSEIEKPKNKLKFRMEAMFELLKSVDEEEKLDMPKVNKEVKQEIPEEQKEMQVEKKEVQGEKKEVQGEKKEMKEQNKEMSDEKKEMQEEKKELKKKMQDQKSQKEDEEECCIVFEDEDCIVLECTLPSPSKKIKVKSEPEVNIKKEIDASDEFNEYVKNHFSIENNVTKDK